MEPSFQTLDQLKVENKDYHFYSLTKLQEATGKDLSALPFSLKILLENLLRFEDGKTVKKMHIEALLAWLDSKHSTTEIAFRPTRVLMQDFTGVPAVVDLASMRDAIVGLGGVATQINPRSAVDLVIDHSVQVDAFGNDNAFEENVTLEVSRNKERYQFLRWGQEAFEHFRVVPPGTGICHQVNLEYLAHVVWTKEIDGKHFAIPDSVVGTDSHTTMINGVSVLGWGVGGIEAEAAMLGQPISMIIPEVIGVELIGELKEGVTATDLVLTITHMLREYGVVGKFVEFCGSGLDHLTLADRATIANMSPEYGATCGFFPIDQETLDYLTASGRDSQTVTLVEAYAKAQGLWRHANAPLPTFTHTLTLNLSEVNPSIAGPKRPQDKIDVKNASIAFTQFAKDIYDIEDPDQSISVEGKDYQLTHGDIVIAAITSCTNTSNPSVMIAAGLVARKARAKGLTVKPWVKTSLAPGSQVVTEYYEASGLQDDLDALGFNLVGYGCTTCIGNSGPLDPAIESTVNAHNLLITSVLSGNRNFEGRIHPLTKGNYLASPPLVVAYAIAGTININLIEDVIGNDKEGNPVYLKDIWPSKSEIKKIIDESLRVSMFTEKYQNVFKGDRHWQELNITSSTTYDWDDQSSYVKKPPYFEGMTMELPQLFNIEHANILALLGDSITTDHISPAGAIPKNTPAARYLNEKGIEQKDFNSYGSRRGNHEVMMRGTFANIRVRNEMLPDTEGGITIHIPSNKELSIYDAAMEYKAANIPLVIIAGKEYGTGSSRDWAAKGTMLLGVKAVIAESFERIHRSNLIGMGILPLMFKEGVSRKTLGLNGTETISIEGIIENLSPKCELNCTVTRNDKSTDITSLTCRIDTEDELEYYQHGGILHKVLREMRSA